MGEAPCPIPYQGSKRRLAPAIVGCLPAEFPRLYEPFAGSAAVALATAVRRPDVRIELNDTNAALAGLWREIIDRPAALARQYRDLWTAQLSRPREFYDEVRAEFNATDRPELLLYLLARCVKAAVRYNHHGQFNQSPDNRRLGSRPARMAAQIGAASALLRGRTAVTCRDFRHAVARATPDDVIYLDPPYQGVVAARDRRYLGAVGYDDFVTALAGFNARGLSYVISYDGRTGDKTHGRVLPPGLGLEHRELDAGWSTQATLAGGAARTVESLYLSPALVARL